MSSMLFVDSSRRTSQKKFKLSNLLCPTCSDNFWSAFFVFHAHFWGKTHSLKICAKKRNDFRQLKRSNFRVKKGKTEENLSKFLNNMAYKTVSSMRDCIMKRNFMLNINSFYFDKMHMLYNKRKSCVKSCKKTLLFKNQTHCFPKKPRQHYKYKDYGRLQIQSCISLCNFVQIVEKTNSRATYEMLLFSSPEHEVLMVSYCSQWLSVVRRRPSCVVRRPSTFDVYTLETTFVIQ